MSYQEPEWSKTPPIEYQCWYLVEIKGGVEVAKHQLFTRRCTILGRATDMVHIPIHHESASRQHARIAFDSQGIPWLRDLKSTHGTTCNKKRLPPQAVGKQESNSKKAGVRGIMLFPGDILQFGASTRIFSLEGPSDFDRGAIQAILQKQKQPRETAANETNNSKKLSQSEQHAQSPISWGIDMGDDVDTSGVSTSEYPKEKTLPMDVHVPEKHRKALERLNSMKYKLANLETEDGRIRRKGDLTEGQERQLQRNASTEESLKKSIVDLESELYDKLYPEKSGKSPKRHHVTEEEEDDFFDRTKHAEVSVVENSETEQSLAAKWKRIHNDLKRTQSHDLKLAYENVRKLSSRYKVLQDSGEDEEAFYVQNDLNLALETQKKIQNEEKLAAKNLSEIEKFLRVVNPKVVADRETGYIGEGPAPQIQSSAQIPKKIDKPRETHSMLPPPVRAIPLVKKSSPEFSMPPPPPVPRKSAEKQEHPTTVREDVLKTIMPPPKKKRVMGPPTATFQANPTTAPSITPPLHKTQQQSIRGTLSFLSPLKKDHSVDISERGPTHPKKTGNKTSVSIDNRKDEWRAPEGQDGSGFTKLNAKFAGRY